MAETQPVLDYISPLPAPRKLILEEADGFLRVTFPVGPKWTYILPIVMWAALGFMPIVVGFVNVYLIWHVLRTFRGVTHQNIITMARRLEAPILISAGIDALPLWILSTYLGWKYRRWGRVPRVLTVSASGAVLTNLSFSRMRERMWPADKIEAIRFKPVWGNLNRKQTAADLYFLPTKRWWLRFRLSSPDPRLPSHIAQRIALMLDRPLI